MLQPSNRKLRRVRGQFALARARVRDLCHGGLGTVILAFLTWAEDIAKTWGEGGGGKLDEVVRGAGEVYTVKSVFSSLDGGNIRGIRERSSKRTYPEFSHL